MKELNKIWHLFVPHHSNNHRAYLVRPSVIALFISIYLLNQSLIKSFTIIKPGILGYSSEITAQKVIDLTNQQRLDSGLKILHYNPTLSLSAIEKAKDMFANDYWAHNSPQGKTPWDFLKDQGYEYSVAGENLAKDFYDTDSMIRAWMNSPTHRENILNSKYQEIGIGVVNGVLNGVKTTLVVQHFGTPLSGIVSNSKTASPPVYAVEAVSGVNEVSVNKDPIISPLKISQIVGFFMFSLIIAALVVDGYFTLKNRTQRLAGSAAGHVGFLAIIFILLLANQQGRIF